MSTSDSDDPKKEDSPETPENASDASPEETGSPEEASNQEDSTANEPTPKADSESDAESEAVDSGEDNAADDEDDHDEDDHDPYIDHDHDYDYDQDHDHDPYEHGLPDAEHYEGKDAGDPFESVATEIESRFDMSKRIPGEGDDMSFLEHLEDLRGTIFKSLVAFLVMGGLMIPVIPYISDILQWPLVRAFGSHDMMTENLKTFRPFEVFSVFLQMIFFGALGLSLPFILYFVAQFIAPGLTDKEKHVLRPGLMGAFFLFIFGVAMTYFIILPMALYFIIFFNDKLGFEQIWWAGEYYSMVVWMCLGVGALFQFPLVLVLLCYIGILSAEVLQKSRRLVVVIVLVVAALVTPGGDPVTLLFMAAPLYGLFEGSIVVARIVEKKQRAALDEPDEA